MSKWEVEFFCSKRGEYPVMDFINALPLNEKAKAYKHIELLEEMGYRLGMPQSKQLTHYKPLRELRPLPNRIIYFLHKENRIILLHAFVKKRNKTLKKELKIAWERMQEFLGREENV